MTALILATKTLILNECDCCANPNRVLHHGYACGIETFACAACCGGSLADDADDIADEIEALREEAETGEHWAHICALEAAYVEATGHQLP